MPKLRELMENRWRSNVARLNPGWCSRVPSCFPPSHVNQHDEIFPGFNEMSKLTRGQTDLTPHISNETFPRKSLSSLLATDTGVLVASAIHGVSVITWLGHRRDWQEATLIWKGKTASYTTKGMLTPALEGMTRNHRFGNKAPTGNRRLTRIRCALSALRKLLFVVETEKPPDLRIEDYKR